jgi:hypothetical protein
LADVGRHPFHTLVYALWQLLGCGLMSSSFFVVFSHSELYVGRLLGVSESKIIWRLENMHLCLVSGSGNRSNPHPDRGRLSCMAVGPLSRSGTIKGGKPGHGNQRSSCPQCPTNPNDLRPIKGALKRGDWLTSPSTPDRLPTTLDSDPHRRHVFVLVGSRYTLVVPRP